MSPIRESGLLLWVVGGPESFVSRVKVAPTRWEMGDGKQTLVRLLQ